MDQRQVIAWCSGDSRFLGEPVCFPAVLLGHLFGQSIDLNMQRACEIHRLVIVTVMCQNVDFFKPQSIW